MIFGLANRCHYPALPMLGKERATSPLFEKHGSLISAGICDKATIH